MMASHIEESPLQLATLQFSPEGFGMSMSGPATAPAYPQHKLLWDPDQNTDGMSIDFPTDDPFTFGDGTDKGLGSFVSSETKAAASQLPLSPSFDDFGTGNVRQMDQPMSSTLDPTDQAEFFPTGLMIQGTSKGVDPSLLFSSPGHPSGQTALASLVVNETLQPYANQIRDAQIERELSLERKAKRRRKVQDDSPAVKAALQALRDENDICAEIKRTATDDIGPQLRAGRPMAGRVTFKSREVIKRDGPGKKIRSLKHYQRNIPESRNRTAITLTIDENGRAKTETKSLPNHPGMSSEGNIDVDDVSEESESASSTESEEMTISQPQSFAFTDVKPRKLKPSRYTADSKAHSQKSSYASTFATSDTTFSLPVSEKSIRRKLTNPLADAHRRRITHVNHRSHRALSPTTISDDMSDVVYNERGVQSEDETETAMTSDDDKGDAQSELRKIIRNRSQYGAANRSTMRKSFYGPHHAYASFGDQPPPSIYSKSVSYSQGRAQEIIDDISPTTITDPDLATPSTSNESHGSDSTRCVCHMSAEIEGELMILW